MMEQETRKTVVNQQTEIQEQIKVQPIVQSVSASAADTGLSAKDSKPYLWKPGQSGNPHGRPKKDQSLIDYIRGKLNKVRPGDKKQRTYFQALAEAELEAAIIDPQARKNLFDRLFGRAVEQMNLNQTGEVVLRVQYDDDSSGAHYNSYGAVIEAKVTEIPPNPVVSIPQLDSAPGQTETPPTPQGDRQETGG